MLVTVVVVLLRGGAASWLRGLSFAGGEHSSESYGTAAAERSLQVLAETGASHVRLEASWYMANESSVAIARIATPGSPLNTTSDAALASMVAEAQQLGLNVSLAPLVDLDWDKPEMNVRLGAGSIDSSGLNRWTPLPTAVSRADIGRTWVKDGDDAKWEEWFTSLQAFVCHYAAFAERNGVVLLDVATDLDVALAHGANLPRWLALIAAARAAFSGELVITTANASAVPLALWAAVDYIGFDAASVSLAAAPYTRLSPHAPQSSWMPSDERLVNLTAADVAAAWSRSAALPTLAALHAKSGRRVIFHARYQSRPNCIVRPEGVPRLDCGEDCSCWTMCIEMRCQAAAFDGLLRVLTAKAAAPWFAGIFVGGWTADPSSGGTSCPYYTPAGKPAEAVLRAHFSGQAIQADLARPRRSETRRIARELRARNAVHAAVGTEAARARKPLAPITSPTPLLVGYVFGGGEWSYPGFALDSAEAKLSLDAAAETGANTVEFTPMWYFNASNATAMYPIGWDGDGREDDPLRTTSDDELHGIVAHAQSLGLTPVLSPMLDPDYHHFTPMWTRDCAPNPWRGTIGKLWGGECSRGSAWDVWHANYATFILRYARLANAWGVEHFVVTHELYAVNDGWDVNQTGVGRCNDLLERLVAAVRVACPKCTLSAVITRREAAPWGPRWYSKLDVLATDYYPSFFVGHPSLPWQTSANLSAQFAAAIASDMQQYRRTSAYFGGKQILITEYGFQSQPWSYSRTPGAITGNNPGLLDVASCEVTDQCVSMRAQALGYDLSMRALFAEPWFKGIAVWLWRADPTHGGAESDSFSPNGKSSIAVLAKWFAHAHAHAARSSARTNKGVIREA